MRLIDHLRGLGMSNRDAKAALITGKVYVGDVPTADAAREIDVASVRVMHNAPRVRPWHDPVVVYRDDDLAVIAKPPGMLAVPAASKRGVPSVLGMARKALGEAFAVHRLDEGTSGLMLVARNESCQGELKDLFFTHDVQRDYLALVAGDFPRESLRHESVLVADRGDGLRGSDLNPNARGKNAISHFRLVRAVGKGRSLVEARLETGRTHQIRIHLAELGFPILGDGVYAPRSLLRAAPRLALHAHVLGFVHPNTGARLHFSAPLADDLEQLIRQSEPSRRKHD